MIDDTPDAEGVFTASAANIEWFIARIVAAAQRANPNRVLDIGCGDASLLVALAPVMPAASLIGVDLSAASIAAARTRIAQSPHRARLSVVCSDYMMLKPTPVGLITAFGSPQAILAPIDQLAATLARDLLPGGLLVYVMPYRCLYNSLLNTFRQVLRSVRGGWSDWIILQVATLLHRDQSHAWLRQRLDYMYLAPGHNEDELRKTLRTMGFSVLHSEPAPHTSIGQLKQRLTVLSAPTPRESGIH